MKIENDNVVKDMICCHSSPKTSKGKESKKEELSTLPSLLSTNQCDDAAQLGALRKLLLLRLLVHILACSNVVANSQHAVLQCQQLRQRVVKEGRAKRNVCR